MIRCTKIVATIGPASRDESTIRSLLQAGVDVARLNFSHGSHTDHAVTARRLRAIAGDLNRPICILQDLQGPKIRTGVLAQGEMELVAGQSLTLTTEPIPDDGRQSGIREVPVDFPELTRSVEVGKHILLDDGNLELMVTRVTVSRVETRVIQGGILRSHKGINLPGAKLDIPGFTEKDKVDLAFGLSQGVDAVAVSFVRTADDVRQVRQAVGSLAPERCTLPIIAKLERPEALDNLDEIVVTADGAMVARGDLGVEMLPEVVPIAQKRIIECANRHAKIVITATQMLDSMIHNPRPTRAEASDVANAIFDGSDAVMLSGETAIGEYPIKAVEMMDAIICQAEAHAEAWGRWKGLKIPETDQDDTYFTTQAARELAHDRNVAAIAVFTQTGRTALLMSKARPGVPILAFTPNAEVYQLMGLYWGVIPHIVPQADTIETVLAEVEAAMAATIPIPAGQQIVLVCGFPLASTGQSNLTLLHTVGKR